MTTVEDQQKYAVPLCKDTETLFYNHRQIIDSVVDSEPRCWLISKVNRLSPNGICIVTLKQDRFNQHTDYIEKDEFGNIIGQWADYFSSSIEPTPIVPDIQDDDFAPTPDYVSTITCSGKKQIKIGGSTKTLTVRFTDGYGDPIEYQPGEWSFSIDDAPISEDLLTVTDVSDGKIKVKFHGGDEYINKVLIATYTSGDVISSLSLEIIPL